MDRKWIANCTGAEEVVPSEYVATNRPGFYMSPPDKPHLHIYTDTVYPDELAALRAALPQAESARDGIRQQAVEREKTVDRIIGRICELVNP